MLLLLLLLLLLSNHIHVVTAEPGLNATAISGKVDGVVGFAILVTSLVIVGQSIAFIRRRSAKSNITPLTRDLSTNNEGENTLNINIHGKMMPMPVLLQFKLALTNPM